MHCRGFHVFVFAAYRDESVVQPPSHCPACNTRLRARDLVPVFSFLVQGRKCRYCKQPISWRYAVVESITGLAFAALLVYLLMVVNYQSWRDPFIIICALPGAFCGIVWALFLTQTTFSVPSLMGAIMSIGVATANSILLVTFAKGQSERGYTALEAAVSAGSTRLRPIVMTAFAMIVGMLPMALGLGEGGEQNAPLARAVIGGLSMATFATLFFVPLMYSLIHGRREVMEEEIA